MYLSLSLSSSLSTCSFEKFCFFLWLTIERESEKKQAIVQRGYVLK